MARNNLMFFNISFIHKKGDNYITKMVEEEKNDNEAPKEGEEK